MSLTGKSPSETYKDIIYVNNSNNGVASGNPRPLKSGNGTQSSLSIDDRSLQVKSYTDNTIAFEVKNASNTSKFLVDTTNSYVKANGVHVNTQYAHFGIGSGDSVWAGASADTHYAVPFNSIATQALVSGGTSTDPATSFTIATTGDDMVGVLWYVMDDITIDRIVWWAANDHASGDVMRTHLMSYTIDSANGSTSGDLSSGAVVAYSSDVTSAGSEQSYYNQMTISTANIDAGKALLFIIRTDSTALDTTINATVKYHIRG